MTTGIRVAQSTHRTEVRRDDKLVAWAVLDAYGWALLARRDGRVLTLNRVDPIPGVGPRHDRLTVRQMLLRYAGGAR